MIVAYFFNLIHLYLLVVHFRNDLTKYDGNDEQILTSIVIWKNILEVMLYEQYNLIYLTLYKNLSKRLHLFK